MQRRLSRRCYDACAEWQSVCRPRIQGPKRIYLDALIADDWSMLTSLVGRIREHQGSFGEWVPPRRIDDKQMATGYCVTGELVGEAS